IIIFIAIVATGVRVNDLTQSRKDLFNDKLASRRCCGKGAKFSGCFASPGVRKELRDSALGTGFNDQLSMILGLVLGPWFLVLDSLQRSCISILNSQLFKIQNSKLYEINTDRRKRKS
ncbi:MAG: hypothetical protein K2H49_04760, partial [Muribaculaceae bacterium]|nr:hypothetical protein [Muribaculaceae bacterium]